MKINELFKNNLEYIEFAILISLIIIGFVFTLNDIFLPWSLVIFVLIYGIFIIIANHKAYDLLLNKSDNIYFLGFIYTLTSLLILGMDIPELHEINEYIPVSIRFFSSAISTTIAGLILRQISFSYANNSITKLEQRDYSKYLNEIAIAHDEFKKIHKESMHIMSDFLKNRKKSLREEEEISTKYVNALKEMSSSTNILLNEQIPLLKINFNRYIAVMSDFVTGMRTTSQTLMVDYKMFANNNLNEIKKGINESFDLYMKQAVENISKSQEDISKLVNIQFENIKTCTDKFVEKYNSNQDRVNQLITDKFKMFETITDTFAKGYTETFKDTFGKAVDGIGRSNSLILEFIQHVQSLNSEIQTLKSSLDKYPYTVENVKSSIDNIDSKLNNLDAVLDGFIEILDNKTTNVLRNIK